MNTECITPGHWEIENFTVQRDQTTGEWVIHAAFGKPLATVATLAEARAWIADDLDSIDLGMGSA